MHTNWENTFKSVALMSLKIKMLGLQESKPYSMQGPEQRISNTSHQQILNISLYTQ